jgi:glutaredoxin 3
MEVRIYTTSFCGYCVAAKALLKSRGATFDEIDVTRDFEQREWLVAQTGQRTVPQIFVGGVPIGGFRELRRLDRDGKLEAILRGEQAPEPVHG